MTITNYLEVSNVSAFTTLLYSIEAEGTQLSLSAYDLSLPNGTYYWRIKTVESGNPDAYTPSVPFTTVNFDGTFDVTLSEGGNNTVLQTTQNSITVPQLKHSTQYTWNVTAGGLTEDAPRTFDTLVMLDAPTNFDYTYDNANKSIVLTWDAVVGATQYRVLYKTNYEGEYVGTGLTLDALGTQNADSPVIMANTITTATLYNLAEDVSYWFAVEVFDGNNWSLPNEIQQNITPTAEVVGGGGTGTQPAPEDVSIMVNQDTKEITCSWVQL